MTHRIRDAARAAGRVLFDSVRDAAAGLHARTGVGDLVAGGGNAILLYHGLGDGDAGLFGQVRVERFRADMRWLATEYEVVTLAELAGSHGTGRLAVTFDDGWASVSHDALPVLREFDVPATVFVSPDLVGDRNPELTVARHGRGAAGGMLTDSQVAALADEPLVTVGNHTLTHPRLDRIDDHASLHREIVGATERLESRYGITATAFSYPHGATSEDARQHVEATHQISVTAQPFLLGSPVPRHGLPRVSAHGPPARIRWELSPLSDRLNAVRYH